MFYEPNMDHNLNVVILFLYTGQLHIFKVTIENIKNLFRKNYIHYNCSHSEGLAIVKGLKVTSQGYA